MKFRLIQIGIFCLMLFIKQVHAATLYVDLNSPSPMPPYTNWATAANVIQDAIDAADSGDLVLVTNGVYATGGRAVIGTLTNRVAITKAITVQSVNGPQATIIQGIRPALLRCAYLTNGAMLCGFTLTNGAADSGGSVFCVSKAATVTNCVLTGNTASFGGGTFGGSLIHCMVVSNSAGVFGGGAASGNLTNCVIARNYANVDGGGVDSCNLVQCTVVENRCDGYGGGMFGGYAQLCSAHGLRGWGWGVSQD